MLRTTLPLKISLSILFFSLFALLFSLVPRHAYAETYFPWGKDFDFDKEFSESTKPDDPTINSWKWVYDITAAEIGAMKTLIGGATVSAQTGETTRSVGVLGMLGSGVDNLIHNPPPVNTGEYLASLNPLRAVYAEDETSAGISKLGIDVLGPIRTIWGASVKVAYAFLVIALIISGFMIMFRSKLDPRTTVTIYSALPRVAISLILITLSYAIVGVLIDFYRVILGLLGQVLTSITLPPGADPNASLTVGGVIRERTLTSLLPGGVLDLVGGAFKALTGGEVGGFNVELPLWNNPVSKGLLSLVLYVALLFLILSLFFRLLGYWVGIFIYTIIAPFVFLVGAIPGYSQVIGSWFKRIVAALLVFVGVQLMLNLSVYFATLTFDQTPALLGGKGIENLSGLIGFGILLLTAKVPDAIEDALKTAPSPGVGRAGVQLGQVARKIPFLGGFAG